MLTNTINNSELPNHLSPKFKRQQVLINYMIRFMHNYDHFVHAFSDFNYL